MHYDNAQTSSKRGKNNEIRYEPQASSVTDILTTKLFELKRMKVEG